VLRLLILFNGGIVSALDMVIAEVVIVLVSRSKSALVELDEKS
jgi:hypothetical protein